MVKYNFGERKNESLDFKDWYEGEYLDGKYHGYGPIGGIHAGGINAPRFLDGNPFVQTGDADGLDYEDDDGEY